MGLMIYNSLSGKVEEFQPIHPGKVQMYVCGPTVYSYLHIGNARPIVFYDILKNYLTFLGYQVTYASNVTDVDDKIIQAAIRQNKTEKEIAEFYEQAYYEAIEKVGSHLPDLIPHATDYVADMIDFIRKLLEEGYAYEVDGDVFFRVRKISDYGCLSKQVREELEQGARISVNDKKEDPLDFALWKKTEVGIQWDSPFGKGRPGWHTECVVMNHRLFGGPIDIHGGGMDLKFPHHENEIAQCNALYHHHLAKYWMHVGRVDFEGQKMSKSKGNVISVKDFENTKVGMIVRMILGFTPYRNNFSYSQQLYEQYEKMFDKWQRTYRQGLYELQEKELHNDAVCQEDLAKFEKWMNQDLNVQNVLTLLERMMKELNLALRAKKIEEIAMKWNTIDRILKVFGICLFVEPMTEEQLNVYRLWLKCREEKNFTQADIYRNQLVEWGMI